MKKLTEISSVIFIIAGFIGLIFGILMMTNDDNVSFDSIANASYVIMASISFIVIPLARLQSKTLESKSIVDEKSIRTKDYSEDFEKLALKYETIEPPKEHYNGC